MIVELTTADPAAVLQRLFQVGVSVSNVEWVSAYCLRIQIKIVDHSKFADCMKTCAESWKIIRLHGPRQFMGSLTKHPVLLIGMVLLFLLSWWVPRHILFIGVEGNHDVSTAQILDAAAQQGLHFGASTVALRSQTVKNGLLTALPQLQWAGIEMRGCMAIITVSERVQDVENRLEIVGSIVAVCDGVIDSLTVLQGTALCEPGQAVKAGQVLISAYSDRGLCLSVTSSKGEVYAFTSRRLSAVTPLNYQKKENTVKIDKKYTLIFGKKRIFFSNSSGILGGTCAKIYSEYYVTLPGGFRLPMGLQTETYQYYTSTELKSVDAESLLSRFCQNYVMQHMQAGEIQHVGEAFITQDGLCRLDGFYSCREMIGRFRPEENLPNYEND